MSRSAALRLVASLGFLLIAAAEAWPQPAETGLPPGEAFALEFRDHVVRVRARWASGERQEGFGFIVGENQSGAYLVTANHVVRGDLPDQVADEVMLTWFHRSGEEFAAVLLGTNDARRDLAVLRTKLPEGLLLRPELMRRPASRLGRSTRVWYVGRAGEWYVPSQPGTVNGIDLDEQITIDGLNVQVGTSGAPLVTEGGIAGMIVSDTIGGVARAIDVSFVERAFGTWNHPWGMAAPVEAAPSVAAAPTDPPPAGPPGGTRLLEPRGTTLIAPAGQGLLAPPQPPIATSPPLAELDPEAVRLGLAAFAPRPPAPTAGALTLRDISVTPGGPNELEVNARAEIDGLDLGHVLAWIIPGETSASIDVGIAAAEGIFAFEFDACRAQLASRDIHLTWNAALKSFVDAQIELGASTISCPELDVAVRDARLDMGFETGTGGKWNGWLDASILGLVVRACEDLPETCEAARAARFAWPWQGPFIIEKGGLLLSFDDADLVSRMTALETEPEDFWPRHAAFAAPILDPAAAAAGLVEPARVADYLGSASARLSISGVRIEAQGVEVAMEAGEAELEPGWPARFSYDVSGATVTAPGLPPAAPSSARVQIESAGPLDPATLLRGDLSDAVADAAPFAIEVSTTNALGRIEGTGSVAAQRDSGLSLLAAEATVTTGDPVGYLLGVLLVPMVAQATNLFALEQAITEALALTPTGLPEPGREQEYHIRYEPLSGSMTVDGQSATELVGAFKNACLRYGC